MPIGVLTVTFRLSGCRSLKEKRQRLSGLRDRLGRWPYLAVCESGDADVHQRAQWTFVAVSSTRTGLDKIMNDVEQHLEDGVDAELIGVEFEEL